MKSGGNSLIRSLGALVLLAVVGAAGYYTLNYLKATVPCEEPIVYSIGSVDERFDLSEAELKSVLKEAAAIWNTAAGKTLFTTEGEATLPVSLVYDERQAAAELGGTINNEQATYELKKREVEMLIASHERAAAALDAMVATYERAQAEYEKDVAYWNAQGGAPPAEYEKLERTRQSLNRTQQKINAEVARVNAMVPEINQAVEEANMAANKLNSKVDVYNSVAGEDFDQGQYVKDANGTRITIYEFESRDYLVRALAHEFGHALGIEHTKDPRSLMYPYNSGKKVFLTEEDKAALKETCKL